MTDGRIPGKWMSEPRFIEMSADAWCVMTKAIAWSNEAGTDGHIKQRYLGLLHPDGDQPRAYSEIAQLGIWEYVDDGFKFIDWAKPAHQGGLGQSLAAEVQATKERKRRNQRNYRQRQSSGGGDAEGVTGHVTGPTTGDVGQDRTGQDRTSSNEEVVGEHNESSDTEPTPSPSSAALFDSTTGELTDPELLVDSIRREQAVAAPPPPPADPWADPGKTCTAPGCVQKLIAPMQRRAGYCTNHIHLRTEVA